MQDVELEFEDSLAVNYRMSSCLIRKSKDYLLVCNRGQNSTPRPYINQVSKNLGDTVVISKFPVEPGMSMCLLGGTLGSRADGHRLWQSLVAYFSLSFLECIFPETVFDFAKYLVNLCSLSRADGEQ